MIQIMRYNIQKCRRHDKNDRQKLPFRIDVEKLAQEENIYVQSHRIVFN